MIDMVKITKNLTRARTLSNARVTTMMIKIQNTLDKNPSDSKVVQLYENTESLGLFLSRLSTTSKL